MRYTLLTLTFLALPQVTLAAVTISEVAWMGSSASANAEWIELHNDSGSSVDVTGWTLRDGMNLNIELAGTIGAGQFAVLERTSDDSAPGTAFLIYTGALVNTGATLTLRNGSGGIEDQVAGGDNWENIGGDNTTKETAQLGSSGWVTAAATPGSSNVTAPSQTTERDDDDTNTSPASTSNTDTKTKSSSSSRRNTTRSIPLTLPEVNLKLAFTAPEFGYVNQLTHFVVEPSGVGSTLMKSLTYEWNFGDGTVGSGRTPHHIYEFPGRYVVMVTARYGRQYATARHEITVLPQAITIAKNQAGDVLVHNDTKYEVDISGYRLVGGRDFTFATNTYLLPGATITVSKEKLGSLGQDVMFLDITHNLLASTQSVPESPQLATAVAALPVVSPPTPALTQHTAVASGQFQFAAVGTSGEPETMSSATTTLATTTTTPVATTTQLAALATSNTPTSPVWPYLALAGLLVLAIVGSVYRKPTGVAKGQV